MIRSLGSYKNGAVRLLISGEYPERFINFCLNEKIYLWGVKKNNKQLIVWMYLKDFSKIRIISRKSKVKIKIIGRYGLPFLLKRLQKRKVLLSGAILFFLAIYCLSGFVWFIDIQGIKNIPQSQIENILKEEGLKIGVWRNAIDERKVEKKILLTTPTVAWVGIRFTGIKATVEVVEKATEFVESRNLGNLVASKTGVITDCIVLAGEKNINIGDKVKEGDILIKAINFGSKEGKNENIVQAEGIVKAKVQYESYGEAPLTKYVYSRSGKYDFSINLVINDKQVEIKKANLEKFPAYEVEHVIKNSNGWRNSWFTVELIINIYHELNVNLINFTQDEAKNMAIVQALSESKNFIPEDAIVIKRDATVLDSKNLNSIKVKMEIEAEEDIGKHIKYNED